MPWCKLCAVYTERREMTDAITLLRCPFCDSHAMTYQMRTAIYQVNCSECTANGPYKKSTDEAVAAWNTRTHPAIQERGEYDDAGQPTNAEIIAALAKHDVGIAHDGKVDAFPMEIAGPYIAAVRELLGQSGMREQDQRAGYIEGLEAAAKEALRPYPSQPGHTPSQMEIMDSDHYTPAKIAERIRALIDKEPM